MRQKVANQTVKKNFILYKGHTGWKIKTRIFGTLLVGLSAITIAESTGTINAHAETGTGTPSGDTSESPVPTTTGTATLKSGSTDGTPASQESVSQKSTSQESVSQEPASQTPASQEPASKESASQESTSQTPATPAPAANKSVSLVSRSVEPESLSLNDAATETASDATTDTQYQTLTPGQTVKVGNTDGSGVTLSGSQVQDHFTNTVENFNKNGADDNPAKNKTAHPADANGVWQLTTNGAHDYWGSYKMQVSGPQTAHVSFGNEIDFGHDFTMTGALGIGTKTSGGADGVGIVFAPGDPEYATTGKTGGNLGLGGLANAFAFVYDDHHNDGSDDSKVVDPGTGAYFGWRSTDANGVIQNVTDSGAWENASALNLNDRATNPLNDFTMTYVASTGVLSVTIGGQTFTRTLTGIDTSTGYSISIAASTGQDTNDYSAKIDSFTYTPKTASVNVNVKDSTAGDTPVDTTTPVTANIGDTIYVFSTKAAAERAVAADPTLDPKLVTVIPASTTANVYVVDGDQATASNGTVHYIGGDSSIADGAYYSYTVTGDTTQTLTVPISQAFTANVTPVDSVTGDPIPGMDPIQVTTVAGKSVVIQIPGYTPVTVVLAAPATGETVANDVVKINTGTTASTSTDVANPIEHYYTAAGETIDGTKVTANATVGTNESVTDMLNGQLAAGSTAGVTGDDYYWSTVPNAASTDATDKDNPQDSGSILVPTKLTLDKWLQQAADNQTKADDQQTKAQAIYDKFVGMTGITQDQKDAAKQLLDSVTDLYNQISAANTTAKTDLEAAEASTDPATIVKDAQDGYNAIANFDDSMSTFQTDLDNLTNASQDSLAVFTSWSQIYGTTLDFPDVTVSDSGFGATLTDAQKKGFNNPDYFYYVNALDSTDQVTPKDAGVYYFKLTDAGRTYLKSLTTNTNAGFYVSAAVTITPATATPTIKDTSLAYGGVDGKLAGITGSLGSTLADTDHPITQDEFEIVDANGDTVPVDQLQVGGDYTIRYTAAAQTALKADGNYTFGDFGTAKLTVTPLDITVTAPTVTKTYGDTEAKFELSGVSKGELVNNDTLADLGVTLERNAGEDVGSYKIILNSASKLNKNYNINVTDGNLTINKKPITVKATDVNTTYDGTAPKTDGFSLVTDNTLVGDDTLDDLGVTLNPISEVNAGTYPITGTATSNNYAVTVNPGTVTIAQAASSVALDKADMVYGDAFPAFTATNNVPGTTSTITAADFEVVDEAGTVVNADQVQANGKYTVELTQTAKDRLKTENPNYDLTFGTNVLTVNPAAATVTLGDAAMVYGDKLPNLTATNQSTGSTSVIDATGFVIIDDTTKQEVTVDKLQAGGKYTVQLTGDIQTSLTKANPNYTLTFDTAHLAVTKRAVSVTAKDNGKTYGDKDSVLESTVDTSTEPSTGLVNSDDLGVKLVRATGENVGAYKIGLDDSAALNQNYTITVNPGTFTINKKPITVQINNVNATYDGTAHGANGFILASGEALVDGDNNDALGVTLDPISETNVGTYTITGKTDSANYAVTIENGILQIDQAAANVTVGDAGFTYDDPSLPQLSATVSVPNNTIAQSDFEIIDDATGKSVAAADLQAGSNYSIQLNQAAKTRLAQANSNYDFNNYGTGKLTVAKRSVTVKVANQVMNAGESTPENQATLTVDGSPVHAQPQLNLSYVEPDSQEVGTYTIGVTSNNPNYDVTVLPGQLTVLGKDTDANGTVTTTEKDAAGNVVKIDKQWTDGSQTTYTYDPTTDVRTVSEQKDGKQVDQQQLTPDSAKVTLADDATTSTVVALDPTTKQPTFEHDTTQTTTDKAGNVTATTKDDAGNVVKVIKQWTDGSQTTYTYDPTTGNRTVTEQKDGQTVDQQTIAPDATTATLSSGDGVKTLVNAGQPGSQPTFEHDTTQTTTDKAGNVTATTTDDAGNVINVTKQWTDGGSTTYTYDPTTGKQTVTEQKDGQTVDQKTITSDATKATLSSGNGVETIVDAAKPGAKPTFEHDTTETTIDKVGNVTATTKDDAGNVVKVVKQWTDGGSTTYSYDPTTGQRTVVEQKDGQTVDQKTITPDATKATLASGDGIKTLVDAGQPGSQPTFEHDTTQTTTDKAGNVTATTKDANGNVINVTKQWTDGSTTTYTYDPTTGKQTVTEQKDGQTVDQQTITSDNPKATLSSGDGVKTFVNAEQPGAEPTFEHDTTETTTDKAGDVTATTKDADSNVIKVTKQWTDGGTTTYTYDPATGQRLVTEQKDGQTVDQKTIEPDATKATLSAGEGVETLVDAGQPGSQPTFEHDTTQTTTDKAGNATATTKDTDGNVVKVTKQWTDGSQTTYNYDPTTGKQTVTEQKDGQTVDQKTITPDAPKATLASGDGVKTIVDAEKPGAEPTFEHDTTQTTTDKAGNVTATTKDADGNVIQVTKQWTDGDSTTYTYDPTTGKQTVTEQKAGQTVDQKTITPDATRATLSSGDGVKTIVNAEQPGAEPTFEHDTTQTTTDKAGNVTATTKDANGNVVKVTKQWTDGGTTTYTYDPTTGQRTVMEQKDGQTVDQQTIAPAATKATLSAGKGVETLVDAGQPGSQPTFEHETTQTTTDKSGVTTTTTDADGNVVKVIKQWTDGDSTTYTYDPTTGQRTITEQRHGQTVDQQTIDSNATEVTLTDGAGGKIIVKFDESGAEPSFTRQLAAKAGSRQVTSQNADVINGKTEQPKSETSAQPAVNATEADTADVATTGRVQSPQKAKKQQQTELPQTGQKNESLLAQLGVVLLAMLAIPFVRRRSH